MHTSFRTRALALAGALALLALGHGASAQEAAIRKNLAQRFPELKAIDQVSPGPVAGLYEIRVNGSDIYYTDADASHLVVGSIYDTKKRVNLTEARVNKLTAIKFDALPFKDAFTIVRGNGERKIAVFEDPNCGYCRRFEHDLQAVNNVTVYLFLYPILGQDSVDKAKTIWCAKDRGQVWQDWMLREQPLPDNGGSCDVAALQRNVELGRTYKINGTPTLFFINGTRIPGAIDTQRIEKLLSGAAS